MKRFLLSIAICFLIDASVFAQFNFTASNAENTTSTYTDLGNTGSAITTSIFTGLIDYDDDVSILTNIGFPFSFNGTTFSQFYLCSNGFIKLANAGTVAPDETTYDFLNSTDQNIIAPFNYDLYGGSGTPEFRVLTTGSAGSRVCTIQFKNMADYLSTQFSNINFQIRLYEGSGNIEFVYGTFTSNGQPPAANPLEIAVGVMGNNDAASVNVQKTGVTPWANGVFINGSYGGGNYFNNINTVLPSVGRTFRFVSAAPPSNDAEVLNVFTLSQAPLGYGFPQQVSAVIKNLGTATLSNLVVTLNITGANSFSNSATINSLAPGASTTVPFGTFTATLAGTNTVTVSVPSDGNNANNSKAVSQLVTADTYSYADGSAPATNVGFGLNSGILLTRYFMTGTGYITNVRAFISSDINSIGKTIYAVVMNNAGQIIDSSLNLFVLAQDLGSYHTFNIVTPQPLTNTFFYVGIAQKADPFSPNPYFPIAAQNEGNPTRSGAYFSSSIFGGPPPEQTGSGRFMIQAIVNSSAVPVNIHVFTARKNGQVNDLRWETSNELNLSHYEVERSNRGNSGFTKLGSLNASGSATYGFTDMSPLKGMNFYRLRAIDNDEKVTLSEIRSVNNEGAGSFVIFPNPVREKLNINYEANESGEAMLQVFNTDGKLILGRRVNLQQGRNLLEINELSMPSGSYLLKLITVAGTERSLFIKQ